MALNFGAILGGAAEQIVDMQEDKIQRVNLLTDKYWDQHTQNMFDKKAKEDAKAELVENEIQKLSSFYDGNIDAGAALYNKLGGNIETANEFYKAALYQRDTLGEDIKPMLGSIDENFEASGMSAADYAESFRKPVSLDITIPEGTDSKVAKELQKRKTEMEEAGLLPKAVKSDKPTFAELKGFDRSKFNTSTKIDVIKQNLIIKANNLDPNSETYDADMKNLESRIAKINTLQQQAAETLYDNVDLLSKRTNQLEQRIDFYIGNETNIEKTGFEYKQVSPGQYEYVKTDPVTAKKYIDSIMPKILEEFTANVSPRDKEYFNQAAALLGYQGVAEIINEESVEEAAKSVATNMEIEEREDAPALAVANIEDKDAKSNIKSMQEVKAGLKTQKDSYFDLPVEEAAKSIVKIYKDGGGSITLEDAIKLINEEKIARQTKQV